MKYLIGFVLFPTWLSAQMVPFEEDHIVYEKTYRLSNVDKTVLYTRAEKVITSSRPYSGLVLAAVNQTQGQLEANGRIKIAKTHARNKELTYHLALQVTDSSYTYRLDHWVLETQKRKKKVTCSTPEELVKEITNSDKDSIEAEQDLNELDMDIQKLIALLRNGMDGYEP